MAAMQLKLTCVFSLITLSVGGGFGKCKSMKAPAFSRRILSNCVKQAGKDVFGLIKLTKQKKRTVGMLNRQMALKSPPPPWLRLHIFALFSVFFFCECHASSIEVKLAQAGPDYISNSQLVMNSKTSGGECW